MNYLKVKVIPGAPKTEIVETMADGTLKVRVAAPAEKNKANKELCKFLKKHFKAESAEVISGATDRVKLIRLLGAVPIP
jgi:uncharacterized protein (TIGR00251 family)